MLNPTIILMCMILTILITDIMNLSYFPLDVEESWKVGVIKEIVDAKSDVLEVSGFDNDELEAILLHLCTE